MLINFQENQKWGYYNSETSHIISPQFYAAADFVDGYAIVRTESSSNYGVIDENGKVILPLYYSSISYKGNHIFKVDVYNFHCLYNQFGKIVDEQGKEIPSNLQIYKIVQYIDSDLYLVIDQENKEGIVHRGNLIISLEGYRKIENVRNGLISMGDGSGTRCLYDFSGNEILPEYRDFDIVSNRYIIVYAGYDKGYGIVDVDKNIVLDAKFSKIEYVGADTFRLFYQKDRKAEEKTVIIDALHKCFVFTLNNVLIQLPTNSNIDWCDIISEDRFIVSSNYKYGIANSKGEIVVKCEYDQYKKCDCIQNIILEIDNKQYLYNLFTATCSAGYESIVPISPNYYKVNEVDNRIYGIINSDIEVVLPIQYDNSLSYVDGNFCIICSNKKYRITDQAQIVLDNGTVLSPKIISVEPFFDGLARVKNNKNLFGFIDEDGEIVIACRFGGRVSNFHNGEASISVFTKNPQSYWNETKEWKSFINKKGNFIVKYKDEFIELRSDFQLILDFDREVTRAYKNNKWALIDINCIPITQFEYDEVITLCDGFHKVRIDKLWGVVSSTGDTIIPCKYNTINNYDDYVFQIVLNSNQGVVDQQLLINHDGNIVVNCKDKQVVIPAVYDYVNDFGGDYAIVKKNGKYGIINIDGKTVIECLCDTVRSIYNGYAHVVKDNKNYLLSVFNNDSIELSQCDNARYYSDNFIVFGVI